MAGISHIIEHLNLPEEVKAGCCSRLSVDRRGGIPRPWKDCQGDPLSRVGTADAIVDIAGVCLLMHMIAPKKVIASPIHVGSGNVHCATESFRFRHLRQPLFYRDFRFGGVIKGELCTPTGAALLKHFVTEFKEMPVMRTSAIGYGMGKDFECANCVRVLLG